MTTVFKAFSKKELSQRLAAIANGPWADWVRFASGKLAPLDELCTSVTSARQISLDNIPLSTSNKQKSSRLATILSTHFEDKDEITSPSKIKTRDALNKALKLPELYELAVQTGYLPPQSVRKPARKILTDLLWSAAARSFVIDYDYIAVPMLAARVGVSGLGMVLPPKPNPNSELRFAGFLAHLRSFYTDENIQTWTHFLDDYIKEPNNHNKVRRYLSGRIKTRPIRIEEILTGCQCFVTSLASVFHILDEDELARFGMIHSYWLQKFFGYKMGHKGYVKDFELWGQTDSWAYTIENSPHLFTEEIDQKISKVFREQFHTNVQLLKKTFNAVRLLAESSRQGDIRLHGHAQQRQDYLKQKSRVSET